MPPTNSERPGEQAGDHAIRVVVALDVVIQGREVGIDVREIVAAAHHVILVGAGHQVSGVVLPQDGPGEGRDLHIRSGLRLELGGRFRGGLIVSSRFHHREVQLACLSRADDHNGDARCGGGTEPTD